MGCVNCDDAWERQIELVRQLEAQSAALAQRRLETARRAAEARAAVPAYLEDHLRQLAREREQYTVKGFITAVYKMLPDRWTTLAAMVALFEYYMAMHDVSSLGTSGEAAASNWGLSGMGPTPSWYSPPPPPMAPPDDGYGIFAPAAPEESVVEAVFAEHQRRKA